MVVPPFDAPWVRMTVIADPQGATFTASKFVPENELNLAANSGRCAAAPRRPGRRGPATVSRIHVAVTSSYDAPQDALRRRSRGGGSFQPGRGKWQV